MAHRYFFITSFRKFIMTFFSAGRLKSKKVIATLFVSGKSSFAFPVKILYIKTPVTQEEVPSFNYAVSAPKKIFRRAVDRNRIKRQMRAAIQEIFRKNPVVLDKHMDIMLIYVGREMLPYATILKAIHKQMLHLARIEY
jgi:ribonuclease P protein component